jgi:hypothetical protein
MVGFRHLWHVIHEESTPIKGLGGQNSQTMERYFFLSSTYLSDIRILLPAFGRVRMKAEILLLAREDCTPCHFRIYMSTPKYLTKTFLLMKLATLVTSSALAGWVPSAWSPPETPALALLGAHWKRNEHELGAVVK